MKIDLSGVSETLLVTLYMRAKDAKSNHPFLNDRKAAEIISCMDYDFSAFDRVWMSYYGVLARAKLMDREVKRFMADNPGCVVVSVGCGLDTRFDRVDDGQVRWYDLDVPEVIDLRQQFLAESERVTCISGSAFDPSWTEKVEREGRRLLILSEGVMMYWEEAEVQKFLSILSEGKLKEAHYYWTENLPEMPPGLPYYSFDRKQADEILDKQYHRGTGPYREKDGVRLQLSLGYPAGNHNQRNLALILKDMYAKIGIDLIPDEDDFSVYLNKFRDGKYDMVLYTTWGNAYEPYSTLTEMRTDGSGFNMFQRGADDKETLFKAMKEMDSSPERESVLRYMEYINGSFYRNVLFIPLYHDYIIHVCRNDISGFVPQEDAKDRIDITHVFRQY